MKDQIASALDGLPVNSAFIYGSVARGTATAHSDLDTFILLNAAASETDLARTRQRFISLQRDLGFTPDDDYPVEIFTVAQARHAMTAEVHGGDISEDDVTEVLRALNEPKIVVLDSPDLRQLIELATRRRSQ